MLSLSVCSHVSLLVEKYIHMIYKKKYNNDKHRHEVQASSSAFSLTPPTPPRAVFLSLCCRFLILSAFLSSPSLLFNTLGSDKEMVLQPPHHDFWSEHFKTQPQVLGWSNKTPHHLPSPAPLLLWSFLWFQFSVPDPTSTFFLCLSCFSPLFWLELNNAECSD